MTNVSIVILIATMVLFGLSANTNAQAGTLQDLSVRIAPLPKITIYPAREIITLETAKPKAGAVAVIGSRILAVGELDDLKKLLVTSSTP